MMTAAQPRLLPFLGALLLVAAFRPVLSWAPPLSPTSKQQKPRGSDVASSSTSSSSSSLRDQQQSRRAMFKNVGSVTVAAITATTTSALLVGQPSAANAVSVPSASELERLRKGHARIQYMLKNWDDITQVCKNNSEQATKQVVRTDGGDKCEKTPLNVQVYMGYKSTEDPLYRVDKLMVRAASLIKDDFDQADYLEAVENYKEKADNTAMMAYTSSWGEANPNGGKDVIDDYLEKTRLDVVSSEQSLRQILKFLKLEPLPASKNP